MSPKEENQESTHVTSEEAAIEFVEEQNEPAVADEELVDVPGPQEVMPADGPPRRETLTTTPEEMGRRFLQDATEEGERRRQPDPVELPLDEEGNIFGPES